MSDISEIIEANVAPQELEDYYFEWMSTVFKPRSDMSVIWITLHGHYEFVEDVAP